MVAAAAARGYQLGHNSETALHPGLVALQHSEGHAVRQHPRQVKSHAGAGGVRTQQQGRNVRARLLLRCFRVAVQSAHQEAAGADLGLRAAAQQQPFGGRQATREVRRQVRLPLVVGVLQEVFDCVVALWRLGVGDSSRNGSVYADGRLEG